MPKNTNELKILVVEDSQSMIETLRDYLAQMGIRHPMIAQSGMEALQMFQDSRPDIVLLTPFCLMWMVMKSPGRYGCWRGMENGRPLYS